MIPFVVEEHLRRYRTVEHHEHPRAYTAQELAQAEHVSGYRVAKPVVVELGGKLALAVVAASDRVSLGTLEETAAAGARLVPEGDFAGRFSPCEPGSEPPLSMYGVPIFVDERLTHESRLVMPAGTHRDSVVLETDEWLRREAVQPVANLGIRPGEHRT
ncbi:MAG: YbaK/EbsC family protein [Deltaproteobacteria bacterium]|nr:YbaK/EbsC family protein [Deltaproteobacteria bacterium]